MGTFVLKYWAAVEDLNTSYRNMDIIYIYQTIRLMDYGNLLEFP